MPPRSCSPVMLALVILGLAIAAIPAAAEAPPAPVTVKLKSFDFETRAVTVPAGTTVTWLNEDGVFHTATSAWDNGASFDHALEDGESASWTFDTPGTYVIRCLPHSSEDGEGGWSGMVQTITVEPGESPPPGPGVENRVPAGAVGLLFVLGLLALARRA